MKHLSRFFTSLTIGFGCFFIACFLITLFVTFAIPGGVKIPGTFPAGYAIWGVVLFSLYVSAKLAGRVWKGDE